MKAFRTLLLISLLVVSVSCGPASPSLAVFQPGDESPFKITFSYPDNWEWFSPPDAQSRTFDVINVFDPYPAIDPELPEGYRFVSISVRIDSHPRYSMQETIDLFLRNPLRFEVVDDRSLEIDGYNVRWITTKYLPDEYINQSFIDEDVFLFGGDRYYRIILHIPEDEIDGQFHTEFKAMVESIKVLP